ncbi:NAD(P)-dependent oxidoreductase [Sulfobacillus thermosulfidooxidans]|uniref:NAD(P)-dependent oxidoreductase n=1 Tax=Sulfobacillus thermosulfidooxidans TaxID=28034 RepID=UPI000419E4E6|nr:NAD(P)-dependent oxidoreductase [Sulfobacillus thermosulfidooxidans]
MTVSINPTKQLITSITKERWILSERIGFIGLGIMGQKMARNLLRHQPINVYNRTKDRAAMLIQGGATWYDSPSTLAQASQIIFIMVTDDQALREVVLGDEGVLAGIQPGTLVVDHSTVSPQVTQELAERVRQRGGSWADAPVTGGDIGADQATLTIMVGADARDFQRVGPYLQQMGKRILHVGAVGQGQTLKLVSNMVSALNLMAAAEGLQFGLHQGLDLKDMETVMSFGSAQSYELSKILDRLKRDDFTPGFSVANRLKDLRLAIEMAQQNQFSADLGRCALPLYQKHAETGHMDLDESSYVKRWDD